MRQEASNCTPLQVPEIPRAREEAENLLPEQQALLASLDLSINRVDEELRRYLRDALLDSEATPPRSRVILLRAAWGYGKTHYGKQVVPRIAHELGMHYMYITLENLLEKAFMAFQDKTRGRPIDYNKIDTVVESAIREVLSSIILEAAREAKTRGAKATVLFIDELEAILEAAQHSTRRQQLRSYLANVMLNELLHIIRLLLHSEAIEPYSKAVGRVHLILAATPEAYNSIMSLAEKIGIGGRLARRIDVVKLVPLSKSDTWKVVKTLLERYYRLPNSEWKPGIVNAIHVASGGNPGIVIRIVNLLMHESGIECRRIHGKDCVCSLTDPLFTVKIMKEIELPYTQRGSYEALVNRDIASRALEAGDTVLAQLVAYLQPLSPEDAYTYETLLASYGLRLFPIRLYRGDCDRVYAVLDRASRRLADRGHVSITDARSAMDELLHVEPDGSCTVYMPDSVEDYVEVAMLFANRGLRVPNDALREALSELETAAYEVGLTKEDAYAVKPSTLPVLYPPAAVRAIPVIRDPEAAARLYNQVRQLRLTAPMLYGQLVAKGLQILLNTPDSLDSPEDTVQVRLNIEIYSTAYRVPGLIEYYEQAQPLFSVREGALRPEEPVVLIRAYSPPGAKPRPRSGSKAHQVLDVELTPQDAETLAALAYALLKEPREYRNVIDRAAVEDMARRLKEQVESGKERVANAFAEHGVAVPPLLTTTMRSGEELLNAYRLLLFAADNRGFIDLEEATQLLYHAYRVRPYKLRSKKWCKVEVPPIVILDLEAEDHRSYYNEERKRVYLNNLRDKLVNLLREAIEANLARREGNGYRLTQHPVERRLEELRRRGLLEKQAHPTAILRYFLLPSDAKQRSAAITTLTTLIDIAFARRQAIHKPTRDELAKLEEAAARARKLSSKALPCLPSGAGDAAYLAIMKEKGAKLLEPSIIASTAEYFLDVSKKHHLAPLMAPLLLYYTELIERGLSLANNRLDELIRKAFNVIREAEALATELQRLGASKVSISPRLKELASKNRVCREAAHAVEAAKRLHEVIRSTPPSSFSKTIKPEELFRELRFDKCDNKYHFMPLLFYLLQSTRIENELKEIDELIRDTYNKLNKAHEIINELPDEAKAEAQTLINAFVRNKELVIDIDDSLAKLLDNLVKNLEDIRDKFKKCVELRDAARSVLQQSEKILKDAVDRLKVSEDLLEKVRTLASTVGSQDHVRELDDIASKIAEITDEVENAESEIVVLYDDVKDVPCTMLEELKTQVNRARSIQRYAESLASRARDLEESVKDVHRRIREQLERQLEPLRILASRIEKLMEITKDLKARAEAQRALSEYRFYEQVFIDLVNLKRFDEDPVKVLGIAREKLNQAYRSLQRAIVSDVGAEGYAVLEYLLRNPLNGRLRLSDVVKNIAKVTRMPVEDVIRTLYRLDDKEYIRLYLTT